MNIEKKIPASLFNVFNAYPNILSAYYELGENESLFVIEFKDNKPLFLYYDSCRLSYIGDKLYFSHIPVKGEEIQANCLQYGFKEVFLVNLLNGIMKQLEEFEIHSFHETLSNYYRKEQSIIVKQNNKNLERFDSLLSSYSEIETLRLERFRLSTLHLHIKLLNQLHFTLSVKDGKFEFISIKQDDPFTPKISADLTTEYYTEDDIREFVKYSGIKTEWFIEFKREVVDFISLFNDNLENFDLNILLGQQNLDYTKV